MRIIADFHSHSKYSRATSREMDIPHLIQWAKYKGINLLGTGDFTHPLWFGEIKSHLTEDGSGLLKFKDNNERLRFILTAEISSIYSQAGKVRKIHTIVFAPDFATVAKINDKLTGIGNLYSDGRPILGLPAKDLAKIIWDINPDCLIIPAHAWTPWFSIFGSNSGFDAIEECYGDLSKHIYAIETGLSSDPEMNWRLSKLDRITLISNSDAHSPANLGREANVFEIADDKFSFAEIADIIKTKDNKRFLSTIEFFPEEGKYHFDGHRNCGLVVDPSKQKYSQNRCPKCDRVLTIGVANRVEQLADRENGQWQTCFPKSKHIVPLMEIIAQSLGVSMASKKAADEYLDLVTRLGGEFNILLDAPEAVLNSSMDSKLVSGIRRVRAGEIEVEPGYDGVYGKVRIFSNDNSSASQQQSLF